ncbi:unnamed protein product [Schistocephalus solidus]|uniref:ANK_REP_REGION domain-containing protein n=1 Tax=Schistocephalus solidus TaxID=70667 RepID=A0A183SJ43_SCHSO|nr:unnamed protein product [Schistocephalus solidus]
MSVLDALKNGQSKNLINGLSEKNGLNKVDSRGYTALHWACHYRRLAEMRKLLDAGVLLSHPNKDGNTALHLAAQVGFVEGVEELLLRGADPEAIDLNGCTPLIQACQKKQEAAIQLLIKSGSDVNHFTREGYTALHYAIISGLESSMSLLLSNGADANAVGRNGYRAAHIAAAKGRVSALRLLVNHGADCISRNWLGYTPLHLSAARGYKDTTRFLLNVTGDVNCPDYVGSTPLLLACQNNKENVVKLLLEHGAQIELANKHGKTPLQAATANSSVCLVRLLLQHGAEVDRTDNYGTTALHIASKLQIEELIYLLISFGASAYAKQERGRTPYEMYVSSGRGYFFSSSSPFYNRSPSLSNGYLSSASSASSPQPCMIPSVMARLQSNSASRSLSRCNQLLFHRKRELSGPSLSRDGRPQSPGFSYAALPSGDSVNSLPLKLRPEPPRAASYSSRKDSVNDPSSSPPLPPNCLLPHNVPGRRLRPDIFKRFGLGQLNGLDSDGEINSTGGLAQEQPPPSLCNGAEEKVNRNGAINEVPPQRSQSLRVSQPKYIKEIVTRTGVHVFYEQGSHQDQRVGPMGSLAALRNALRDGANANARDSNGNTLLHLACNSTNLAIVELLLSYDADPYLKEETLTRPEPVIYGAARASITLICHSLLWDQSKYFLSFLFQLEDTPLHIAARRGDLKILQTLIRHNANLNARNFNGETALHSAVRKDGESAMRLLLDAGADVNARDSVSRQLLKVVNVQHDHRPYDYSRVYADGVTALHLAVSLGSLYAVKLLLLRKADPNKREKNGRTPLRRACEEGQLIVIQSLIEAGAEVDEIDWITSFGITYSFPLNQITFTHKKHFQADTFDLQIVAQHDRTLLHVAAADGNTDIAKLLLQFGCPVDAQDDQLLTPLHMCCMKGHIKTAEFLCEAGASLHLSDARGRTIEDYAEESGNVPLLLFIQSMLEVQSEESTNSQDSTSE